MAPNRVLDDHRYDQTTLLSLVREDRVHGLVYTDPLIFEAELSRIFYRTWVYVAHESEIATNGDYKTTSIGWQPVIVNRGADDGVIRAFFNRCRHRAAPVCQESSGNANYFRCPYHGWTYKSSGELTGVPFRDGYGPNFDTKSFGLVEVPRVASYGGFVFASLSSSGPDLEEHLGNARPYLDIIASQGKGIVARSGVHRIDYAGNWKLQQENTLDNYHGSVVHRVFVDIVRRRTGKALNISGGNSAWRARDLGNGHGCLDFSEGGFGVELGEVPFNLGIFPNLGFVGVHIRVTRPISVDRTIVETYPTLVEGLSQDENEKRLRMQEDLFGPAGFVTPDDVEVVMERVPEGLRADRGDEWLYLARGLGREEIDEAGVRSSHIADEGPLRSFYRAWRVAMANGEGPESDRAKQRQKRAR